MSALAVIIALQRFLSSDDPWFGQSVNLTVCHELLFDRFVGSSGYYCNPVVLSSDGPLAGQSVNLTVCHELFDRFSVLAVIIAIQFFFIL